MERNLKNCVRLFAACFFVSAFTFGGGYVIVPLMKKRFVDELGWIDEDDMLNMVALAQSAPGAIAINASVLVGRRLLGGFGAVIALAGTVLPPFAIMVVVALLYERFRDLAAVSAALKGLMAGICAVIVDAVAEMAISALRVKRVLSAFIMAGAFLLGFMGVNVLLILAGGGAAGVAYQLLSRSSPNAGGGQPL